MEKVTGKTPQALLDRPDLPVELVMPLEMFYTLSATRPLAGMGGPGPIPVSEVLAYFQLLGISDLEHRRELLGFVQRLDRVYMEMAEKKQTAKDKATANSSKQKH